MAITATTLDLVSLKAPQSGGVVLPEQVRRVVVRPQAPDRIVLGRDHDGREITQARFNGVVAGIWPGMAPRSRAILAGRILNPREPLALNHFGTGAKGQSELEDYVEVTEATAIDIFKLRLKEDFGIDLTQGPITHASREHLYFIPVPEKIESDFVDTDGRPVPRGYLEQAIRYGFGPGEISDLQAMFLLNAQVSVFRLSVSELSQLVGFNLSTSIEREALHVVTGLLGGLGLRPAEAVAAVAPVVAALPLEPKAVKNLSEAERVRAVIDADESALVKFCNDSSPAVIHAIVRNPRFNQRHARLIAEHHQSTQGLGALFDNGTITADPSVRAALLQNSVMNEPLLRRLLSHLSLQALYSLSTRTNEMTEQAKREVLALLKQKFQAATPDEKVRILVSTEGRCLDKLTGVTLGNDVQRALMLVPQFSAMLAETLSRRSEISPGLKLYINQRTRRG